MCKNVGEVKALDLYIYIYIYIDYSVENRSTKIKWNALCKCVTMVLM